MYGQVKYAQVKLPEIFKLQNNSFDSYVKITNSNDKYPGAALECLTLVVRGLHSTSPARGHFFKIVRGSRFA